MKKKEKPVKASEEQDMLSLFISGPTNNTEGDTKMTASKIETTILQEKLNMNDDMELITDVEAAEFYKTDPRILRYWRYHKEGPVYYKLSELVIRYRRKDLLEYIDKKIIKPRY